MATPKAASRRLVAAPTAPGPAGGAGSVGHGPTVQAGGRAPVERGRPAVERPWFAAGAENSQLPLTAVLLLAGWIGEALHPRIEESYMPKSRKLLAAIVA